MLGRFRGLAYVPPSPMLTQPSEARWLDLSLLYLSTLSLCLCLHLFRMTATSNSNMRWRHSQRERERVWLWRSAYLYVAYIARRSSSVLNLETHLTTYRYSRQQSTKRGPWIPIHVGTSRCSCPPDDKWRYASKLRVPTLSGFHLAARTPSAQAPFRQPGLELDEHEQPHSHQRAEALKGS